MHIEFCPYGTEWRSLSLPITWNVTRPGKKGLIYTKYMCSYYGTYLLCCMCYPNSVGFIEFLMDFSIYDNMLHNTDKKLLHLKLSKSGQFYLQKRQVFPVPVTNLVFIWRHTFQHSLNMFKHAKCLNFLYIINQHDG